MNSSKRQDGLWLGVVLNILENVKPKAQQQMRALNTN